MFRTTAPAALILAAIAILVGCEPAGPVGEQHSPSVMSLPTAVVTAINDDDILTVDQLRPGMKGYGLTVFAGARPERFDVEIISVLRNYDPKADMILIRCSGNRLEKTGVAAGMSGSPIYIDGKLIGALAYGWRFTVEPIAGVQPIKQMLCNSGLRCDLPPATQCDVPDWAHGGRTTPGGGAVDLAGLFSRQTEQLDEQPASRSRRHDIRAMSPISEPTALRPLSIPLAVSGGSSAVMGFLAEQLEDRGIVPLKSGGNGSADPRMGDARIEPGGTVTIPLMTGDMDISAIGTVTAVINDRVLAFGHPMFGEGPVNMPMAVGVVHTFIPSMASSFKMGSAGPVVGAVRRDENASILGVFGQMPSMTPVTIHVSDWTGGPRREFRYQVVDEPYFAPMLSAVAAIYSAESQHGSPVEQTVYYSGRIRFRSFAEHRFSGVGTGGWATRQMAQAIMRPIGMMMNNPWGKAFVESVEVDIRIVNETRSASIEHARLEQSVLLPGEPAVIHASVRRYKKPRLQQTFTIDLPEDLPDGSYQLALLDCEDYRRLMTAHDRRAFMPENMVEMVTAMNRLAEPRDDHLYAVLTLPKGGLATRSSRLPALPPSRAMILRQADREELTSFTENIVWPLPKEDMAVTGSRQFTVTIDRNKGKR